MLHETPIENAPALTKNEPLKEQSGSPSVVPASPKLPAHTFDSFTAIVSDPLALNHLGQFISRIAAEQIKALFDFVIDADRCLRHNGGDGEAKMLNNIIKTYLLPGRPQYIYPGGPLLPLQEIEEHVKNGAISALHRAALKRLDEDYFKQFLESPEYEQLSLKNADNEGPGGHDPVTAKLLESGPVAQKTPPTCVSFCLVKVNNWSKRQNRTLALSRDGVDSLRGDTKRFHYDAKDVHGVFLDPDDNTKFRLACLHYYEYECDSEAQRFCVAEAFESLGLGVVEPPAISAIRCGGGVPDLSPPTMSDFERIKVIGRGGLGKVLKVKHTATNRLYAMKLLKVPTLIKHKQVERARMEKEILMTLNHPFLVRLHYSFVDSNQLCMVLDFAAGGDLFFHLRKARGGRLHHMPAGFYVAEMVCALEYLHNHDIIHRDLKPENILMDQDGHLLLTDFGLSKADITSDGGEAEGTRAVSMVGTKEYVAPEVVQRKPYGKAVDWWAVGVLFYELLFGHTPFDDKPGHVFDHIVKEPIRFQEGIPIPRDAKELIMGLLNRDPQQRFDAKMIKSHAFFTQNLKMDWDKLEQKDIPPPLRPQMPGGDDSKNFPERFVKDRLTSFVEAEPRLEEDVVARFNYSTTV